MLRLPPSRNEPWVTGGEVAGDGGGGVGIGEGCGLVWVARVVEDEGERVFWELIA